MKIPVANSRRMSIIIEVAHTHRGLTEWLRSPPGTRVRRNSPVGSNPMPSASERCTPSGVHLFVFGAWDSNPKGPEAPGEPQGPSTPGAGAGRGVGWKGFII